MLFMILQAKPIKFTEVKLYECRIVQFYNVLLSIYIYRYPEKT